MRFIRHKHTKVTHTRNKRLVGVLAPRHPLHIHMYTYTYIHKSQGYVYLCVFVCVCMYPIGIETGRSEDEIGRMEA